MVGSNTSSGLGRFAFCETLESRNLFATVGTDAAFHGGKFTTQFYPGSSESADAVVKLQDGRVFVVGQSFDTNGHQRIVAAVFNKDGSLSKSFDGDGKLTLPANVAEKLYSVTDADLLKDGNVLLSGYGYVAKVKLSGQVDTSFGDKGVVTLPDGVDAFNIPTGFSSDSIVRADGTTHYASYNPESGLLRSAVLSAGGKFTTSVRRTVAPQGGFTVLENNELLTYRGNSTSFVRLYRTDLAIESKFGTGGTLDLYPTYSNWAKAQKPWTTNDPDAPTTDVPRLPGFGTNRTTDGYVFHAEIDATSPKQPHSTYSYGGDYTNVNVYVSSGGKISRIAAGAINGATFAATTFFPLLPGEQYPYSLGGVFTTTANKTVTFVAPDNGNNEDVYDFTAAGDGKYYLVGSSFNTTTRKGSFLVARTAYVG